LIEAQRKQTIDIGSLEQHTEDEFQFSSFK